MGRILAEGAQNLDHLAQLPLSLGAAPPGRRFCAVGRILGIFHKISVSHAGYICYIICWAWYKIKTQDPLFSNY